MPSTITSIVSSTVGLLWNKARDATANKLKDGGVTDAKLREIVVRELSDIKFKLDGLSRKDLLSSYSFLKEGVALLKVSLDKSKDEQKAEPSEASQDEDDRGETSRMPSGVESGILTEVLELSHDMGKLKANSDKEFESAKERFKDARKRATDGFCNESLSIKDRIFAAKLRVVSEILECLESPETAVTGCMSFLQELHSLPAIREIFSVYLNGGPKSIIGKSARVDHVKSVMMINYVLFKFVSKFSTKYNYTFDWPVIELADRSFHPIYNWEEISTRKSWGEELIQPPNGGFILNENVRPFYSAMNGRGEIIVGYGDDFEVISRTGEGRVVNLPEPREGKIIGNRVLALAADNNNNIYVLSILERSRGNRRVVMFVLDENYNVKHECTLDFLDVAHDYSPRYTGYGSAWAGSVEVRLPQCYTRRIAITLNRNNDIITINGGDPHVYVCDNTGQLKHKFKRLDSRSISSLSSSDKNEIMIPSTSAVQIYTEEGDLKYTIQVPEGHEVCGVAFHDVFCKIIVLTYFEEKHSFFLHCYSETCELENSTVFYSNSFSTSYWERRKGLSFKSNSSGHVAVVRYGGITFIQGNFK